MSCLARAKIRYRSTPLAPTWSAPPSGSRMSMRCCPEICTLDCGTMNFSLGDYVMTNTPSTLRAMAAQGSGARRSGPKLEVFDSGHLVFVKQLLAEKLIDDPCMIQLCMGIPYGAPDDPLTLIALVNQLPPGRGFQRVLDWPQPTALCRYGGAGWRQCAGGARG